MSCGALTCLCLTWITGGRGDTSVVPLLGLGRMMAGVTSLLRVSWAEAGFDWACLDTCLEGVSCLEQELWGPCGQSGHFILISLPLICILVLRASPGAGSPAAAACSAVVSSHRAGSQCCGRAQCPFSVLSCSRDVMCTGLWLPCCLSADIVSRVLCLGSLFAKAWASKSLYC